MDIWRNRFSVVATIILLIGGTLLITAILKTPAFDQAQLPLFIAALSFVVSAVGVVGSWLVILEMQRDREALYKPEVYADIEIAGGLLFLFVVRNNGRSTAHNITVKLDPCPVDRNGIRIDEVNWLRSPIKTLPPGKCMSKTLDSHLEIFSKDIPRTFKVELCYESSSGVKYSEPSYILDIEQYKGMNVPPPTTEELLGKIVTILEKPKPA